MRSGGHPAGARQLGFAQADIRAGSPAENHAERSPPMLEISAAGGTAAPTVLCVPRKRETSPLHIRPRTADTYPGAKYGVGTGAGRSRAGHGRRGAFIDEEHGMTDVGGRRSRRDLQPGGQKRLGEWLLVGGHLTPEQLEQVVAEKKQKPEATLGQLCVDLGFLSREELDHLLTRFGKRLPIGEMLVQAGHISHAQLHRALMTQRREGGRVGEILLRLGLVTEELLYGLMAAQYNLPFISIAATTPDPQLRRFVGKTYAAQNRLVPVSLLGPRLTVAMSDPGLRGCAEELRRATDLEIIPLLTSPSDLGAFFGALYGETLEDVLSARQKGAGAVAEASGSVATPAEIADRSVDGGAPQGGVLDPLAAPTVDLEVIEEEKLDFAKSKYLVQVEDSPIVQTLVQTVISRALTLGASDIHLEADVSGPRLRFRVDGLLREHPLGGRQDELFRANYRSVISRIKILGHMDIAEKRRPQDASFRMVTRRSGKVSTVDFRLATLPGRFGEGMVIRILDELKAPRALESLGLSPDVQEAFRALIQRSMGIILITGPTGSGKSSTLYGALRTIHRPELKILTVEDPIEFTHPGIVQTEVNASIENTFARFLRAFLRQDPDVIMVGEIRDTETAEMAVRAAQTGHLLLSTLHTTNATAAVQRLLDLYDDSNGLASVLIGVMAQRLVRKICVECREEYTPDRELLLQWFRTPPSDVRWTRGRGCDACGGAGYAGRIVVSELWIPLAYEATLISRRASGEELRKEALRRMPNMAEDALQKAVEGLTTLEEAFRVVPFEDLEHIKANGLLRANSVASLRAIGATAADPPPDVEQAA
jgi:type IV pilus assembly protein PilB